ncbi:uncharacterized protein ACMZJ9_001294 [Mantella aurantiaca]
MENKAVKTRTVLHLRSMWELKEYKHEESEEDEDEDEEEDDDEEEKEEALDEEEAEEDDEEVEEDDKDDTTKENDETVSNRSRTESPAKTPAEVTKISEPTVSSSKTGSGTGDMVPVAQIPAELENSQGINEVQSSGNELTKSTLLEKTRRLSLFKKRSTTSQKSLQGNEGIANASKENGAEKTKQAEKTKDKKDESLNTKQEGAKMNEQPHQENPGNGQSMQDKTLKPTTCVLL